MKNVFAIGDISCLLGKSAEAIGNIATIMNNAEHGDSPELVETYKGMLLNALENAQSATLALPSLVTEAVTDQNVRSDGSVFMPGELDDDMGGEKNVERPGKAKEEK